MVIPGREDKLLYFIEIFSIQPSNISWDPWVGDAFCVTISSIPDLFQLPGRCSTGMRGGLTVKGAGGSTQMRPHGQDIT